MYRQAQQKKRSNAASMRPTMDTKKQKFTKDGCRRVSWDDFLGFPVQNGELSDDESDDEHVVNVKNEPTNGRPVLEEVVGTATGRRLSAPKNTKHSTAQGRDKLPPLWVPKQSPNHSAEMPLPFTPSWRNSQSKDNSNTSTEKGDDNGCDVLAENQDGANDVDPSHSRSDMTNNHSSQLAQPGCSLAKPPTRAISQMVEPSTTYEEGLGKEEHIPKMAADLGSKNDLLQPKEQENNEEAEAEQTKEMDLTRKACSAHWQKHFNMPKLKYKALFEVALSMIFAIFTWFKRDRKSTACPPNPVSPGNSSSEDLDTQDDNDNAGKEQGTPKKEAATSDDGFSAQIDILYK